MDEDNDFLDAIEADKSTPELKEEKVEAPATAATPEAPAAEAEPAATPPPEEPVLELTEVAPGTPKPEPGFVPIAAMLDARDRAKAAEAERDRLLAERQPVEVPDPYADPEGYAAFQDQRYQVALQSIALNTSERFARKEYGNETVEAAKKWALDRFQADPLYQRQVLADPDPYDRTVKDYQREQLFSQVSDPTEFEQFRAWKQAQGQLSTQPAGQPVPATATAAIPAPSLASAPSAGTILTEPVQSEEEMFDEVVGKRK